MDIFVVKISEAENVGMELLKKFQKKEISDSEALVRHCFSYLMADKILKEVYKIEDREVVFNGKKPVLKNGQKSFSISHSKDFIALAFSDFNCGVDIEKVLPRDFEKIAHRMRFRIFSLKEFYQAWTKFEAEYKLAEEAKCSKFFEIDDYMITAVSSNLDESFNLYYG